MSGRVNELVGFVGWNKSGHFVWGRRLDINIYSVVVVVKCYTVVVVVVKCYTVIVFKCYTFVVFKCYGVAFWSYSVVVVKCYTVVVFKC